MTVHVELPASFSEDRVQEWWSIGIRDGWRDTSTVSRPDLHARRRLSEP
jgi:hypothetical protein